MAYQVVWSLKALEDVEAIATYIYRDSASYAASVVSKVIDASKNLKNSPFSGKPVPEFGDGSVREETVYSLRMIYLIQDNTVTITAVIYNKGFLTTM